MNCIIPGLLSPGVFRNLCPLNQWCHATFSSSVTLFSCPQSFPASGSFLMSQPLHQVAKVLEFQCQHQSFQWILRVDFFYFFIFGSVVFILFYYFLKYLFFTLFYFTILYWFYHTLTWIHHGCTCVSKYEPHIHLPPHNISLGHPHAPAPSILYPASDIDWRFVSYMIVYM